MKANSSVSDQTSISTTACVTTCTSALAPAYAPSPASSTPPNKTQHTKPDPVKGSFIKMITGRLVSLIAIEIDKPETQTLVRQKIIVPVINLIYSQLYPYIIILVAIITLILVLSFSTFIFFLIFYFKTK